MSRTNLGPSGAKQPVFPGGRFPARGAMQMHSLILYYNTLRVFVENNGRKDARNVVILGQEGPPPPSAGPENGLWTNFFHVVTACDTAETPCQIDFFEKIILLEWKKVVLLHPLSPKKGVLKKRKRQLFETDEKKEIACVTCPMIDRTGDTETSQDRFGSREESKRACYPEMKKRVERKFKR